MQGGGQGVRRARARVPVASYISVILHGLLQGAAGQLGLRPVPQPSIQGPQVGLHVWAPREVLQSGERGEETQTRPREQRSSLLALLARQNGLRAAPASSTAACAAGQSGPSKVGPQAWP